MPRLRSLKPQYCLHKSSDRAYVRVRGRQTWLGRHGSQESKDAYDAVIGEWIAQGRPTLVPSLSSSSSESITIIELVDAYWNFAKEYYKAAPHRSDGHLASLKGALGILVRLFGETAVNQFGPLKLTVVRDEMAKPRRVQAKRRRIDPVTGSKEMAIVEVERSGWTRGYINDQLKRLKRLFAWGVSRELIPAEIYHALKTVDGLRKGKSAARESAPVQAAPIEDVQKVLPLLPPPVRAMIELESITGMRPGEARIMRGADIEIKKDLWIYRPQWHKTEHCGQDHTREIYLGPRAQLILQPFMHTLDYLFTPKDSDAWLREQKRVGRKTPMTPSQIKRAERAAQRRRQFEPFYSKNAFARCVKRACRKAGLAKGFTPNMLRHSAAGIFRREFGLDSAQILLGHKHAKITEIYAAADRERAMKIVAEVG